MSTPIPSESHDASLSDGTEPSVSGLQAPRRDSAEPKSLLASPRTARVSPSPTPSAKTMASDKGKSKITGKIVSGWL